MNKGFGVNRKVGNSVRIGLLACLLVFTVTPLHAQDDDEYRMEIGAGLGLDGYLGDFNGNLTKDLRPMMAVILRRNLNPYMGLRLSGMFGKLKGSSADVDTYYPAYASIPHQFSRSLVDIGLTYEYNFWSYGTGRDYRGAKRLTPYVGIGVGGTFVSGNGNDFAFNFPIGLGLKYKVADRLNLGLEWMMYFGTSDMLDGVKDPYAIASSGLFKNTDSYSTCMLTLAYSFMPKCKTCNKDY